MGMWGGLRKVCMVFISDEMEIRIEVVELLLIFIMIVVFFEVGRREF